jgi:hypothetical protein
VAYDRVKPTYYILVSSYSTVVSATRSVEECFLTRDSREIVEYINIIL